MAPFSQSKQPRRSLPEGYKFGDARWQHIPKWLRDYDDEIGRKIYGELFSHVTANVIEGDHFASDAERHPVELGGPREFHGVRIEEA